MAENFADVGRSAEFGANVEFELNETPGKLADWCVQKLNPTGASAKVTNRFTEMTAHEIEGRNQDTINTDPDLIARWIHKPRRQAVIPLLDPDDAMSTSIDLKSPLVVGTARAVRRGQDDRWLQGFFGTAYTGEKGTIAVPFKAANIMSADFGTPGTATGITLAKLIRMRRLLSAAFVDLESETPIMPVTAAGIEDLLNIPEVRNRDFNPTEKQALQSGKVATFLGFTFVPVEFGNPKAFPMGAALTVDANGNRRIPVFVPSGMAKATWLDFESHIDLRADKNHSTQLAGYTCTACTRTDEDKCFQMLAKESI